MHQIIKFPDVRRGMHTFGIVAGDIYCRLYVPIGSVALEGNAFGPLQQSECKP